MFILYPFILGCENAMGPAGVIFPQLRKLRNEKKNFFRNFDFLRTNVICDWLEVMTFQIEGELLGDSVNVG